MILPTKLTHRAKQLDGQDLYNYLACLHERHWSIRSIATALEISPTTATKYIEKGTVDPESLSLIRLPDEFLPVKELPTNDYHRLRSISQLARKAASATPNPRVKRASEDLNIYLRILSDEGYSVRLLAEACAITKTAISQRLSKTEKGQYTREDLP